VHCPLLLRTLCRTMPRRATPCHNLLLPRGPEVALHPALGRPREAGPPTGTQSERRCPHCRCRMHLPQDGDEDPPEYTPFLGRTPTWMELSEQPDGLHVRYWPNVPYGFGFMYRRGGCGTEVSWSEGHVREARLDASRRSRFIECPTGPDPETMIMAVLPNVVVAWLWTGLPPVPDAAYGH
jgi:hypothetical protein